MKTNRLLQSFGCCRKNILPATIFVLMLFSSFQIQTASASTCNSCSNVTSGGLISCDQSNCGPFDPALIWNVVSPCGGSGTLQYRWLSSTDNSSWTVIPGACNSTYDPCAITVTTWYKRDARRNGCTDYICSNVVVKRVNSAPSVCINVNGSCSLCSGETTDLCASTPCAGATYSWSCGQTTQCITVSQAGHYVVTVTDPNGCSSTACKDISVHSVPNCCINGDGTICSGQTTTLSAPSGCATYLWNTGATTRCITVGASGTYSVTVTNNHGCSSTCSKCVNVIPLPDCTISGVGCICYGQTTTLSAPQGYASYHWSTGETTRCITVGCAGTYTVCVSNCNGCTSTCSKCVVVNALPVCCITGDNSICDGGCTILSAPDQCASYLWSTGATTRCISVHCAGTYTVTITNQSGCSSTCSKCVTVNPLPLCCIDGDNSMCHGSCITLSAPAQCASYLWSTGETTRCITIHCGGTYSVTVTNEFGCSASCSKCVTENQAPTCCITGNLWLHHNWCTTLSAPWGCNSYLWSNGATTRCITVWCPGTYCVTVTNSSGCSSNCSVCVNWTSSCSRTAGPKAQVDDDVTMDTFGSVEALAFPNPFKSNTTIQFENKGEKANAVVEVYSLDGAKVCELFNNVAEANQLYKIDWNAEGLSNGVYMYRIVCGDQVVTGRLVRKD